MQPSIDRIVKEETEKVGRKDARRIISTNRKRNRILGFGIWGTLTAAILGGFLYFGLPHFKKYNETKKEAALQKSLILTQHHLSKIDFEKEGEKFGDILGTVADYGYNSPWDDLEQLNETMDDGKAKSTYIKILRDFGRSKDELEGKSFRELKDLAYSELEKQHKDVRNMYQQLDKRADRIKKAHEKNMEAYASFVETEQEFIGMGAVFGEVDELIARFKKNKKLYLRKAGSDRSAEKLLRKFLTNLIDAPMEISFACMENEEDSSALASYKKKILEGMESMSTEKLYDFSMEWGPEYFEIIRSATFDSLYTAFKKFKDGSMDRLYKTYVGQDGKNRKN